LQKLIHCKYIFLL